MIAKFYAWDTITGRFNLVLTCVMGSAQYNTGIKNCVMKYARGYIRVGDKTVFRWSWTGAV